MKKESVLVIGIFLMVFMIGSVSAITGSIGNGRIIVDANIGDTIIKYVLVKNINNEPVRINISVSGDLEDQTNIMDEEFTLEAGEQKKVYFIMEPIEEGNTETRINVRFSPMEEGNGVGLSATITVRTSENDFESRISALESWKTSITNTIATILTTLTGHTNRITALENQQPPQTNFTGNFTYPYFKYLGSTDRKNIVCGYAKDNHLAHIEDLGWICDITYKQYASGEKASCKCKKV